MRKRKGGGCEVIRGVLKEYRFVAVNLDGLLAL